MTRECEFIFIFKDKHPVDGFYKETFAARVTIQSECYHLKTVIDNSVQQAALWSWPQGEQDKMAV